jgi:hypothetical protein
MSNEGFSSSFQTQTSQSGNAGQQLTSSDYVKILDTLFQHDQVSTNTQIAFELFEKNFSNFLVLYFTVNDKNKTNEFSLFLLKIS